MEATGEYRPWPHRVTGVRERGPVSFAASPVALVSVSIGPAAVHARLRIPLAPHARRHSADLAPRAVRPPRLGGGASRCDGEFTAVHGSFPGAGTVRRERLDL